MPISNVGFSASLIPPAESQRSAEQRVAAVEKLATASLARNGEQAGLEVWDISRMATDIVSIGQTIDRRLQFVVDHESSEVIVKVIDNATEEVVRVLPPEELQRLHGNLQEAIGFLFDERA